MEALNLKIVPSTKPEEPINTIHASVSFALRTIGDLVSEDFRKAEVLKKYKLDFCCGGKKTIEEACNEKNIDINILQKEIHEMGLRESPSGHNYNQWRVEFMIDFILNTHHAYVREAIPVLIEYTRKVAKVHGENHPEVILIAEKFNTVAEELINHMSKEENILFPYIKNLAANSIHTTAFTHAPFGSVKNHINMMEHEHEMVGDLFKVICNLSNNYTPPDNACMTYKVSFFKLKEFEEDLHQHIHLENNILFPKSIQMETAYFGVNN